MRAVVQRVSQADVRISGTITASIKQGLLILLGIEDADSKEDITWLAAKLSRLRIFSDSAGLMNLSIEDIGGAFLVVSQFTLFASTRKGTRPSFIRAARPEKAIPLYEEFIASLRTESGCPVRTGEFGADMKVSLINDGPVTILVDSQQRE